ncbi:TonB-dependent receptor [Sphingobium sp. DEHP117]|uniref:TonB-dependent receptor n=1 Tax=Sphingobium sp. DEHP117 TaxID=2993436 RepID=UPI0027D497AF|nr:TonB-dependent receptor [Sphingobium sp. DEHP117]MDQ4419037.1 TonB-dependent receptor [Sphingobium sp. DEHP117]
MKAFWLASVCAGAIISMSAAGAVAQTGDRSASASTASNEALNDSALEEIVVTATKRAENLQDVPLSITALTGDVLERQGIQNYGDFARQVPGVVLSEPNKQFSKFTIRGLQTSTTSNSIGEQKLVAVYVDEVPVTSFSIVTPNLPLYDIERVEVLRGPQGTLFGSGSLAGAVRVITAKPNLSRIAARASVDLGWTDGGDPRRRFDAMLNVPLIADKLALRAVTYHRTEGGYVDNVGTGVKNSDDSRDWGGRLALKWAATDDLSVTLMAMHDDVKVDDWSLFDPALGKFKRSGFVPNAAKVKFTSFNAGIEYDLGIANLISSTTYAKVKNRWDVALDGILAGVLPFGYAEGVSQKNFVQEVRLVSQSDSPFQWVAGGFYLKRHSDFLGGAFTDPAFLQSLNITGLPSNQSPGADLANDYRTIRETEAALFGELSYKFTDTVKLTGGLRYTKSRYVVEIENRGFDSFGATLGAVFGGGNVAVPLGPVTPFTLDTGRRGTLTKKVSLTWEPSPNQTIYATAAEGFRRDHPNSAALTNGGKSIVDPNDPLIIPLVGKSDSLWNYEVGLKAYWLDRHLRTNIAAYYIPWDNLQVGLTRSSDTVPFVGNISKAVSKGVEIEIEASPVAALDLGLNLTFQSAKIKALTPAEALSSGAVKGARLTAPEFSAAGFAQYNWSVGDDWNLYTRLDVQHIGSYPNGFPNVAGAGTPDPNYAKIPAYENVSATIGVEGKSWEASLYVENLLNDDTYIGINPASNSPSRYATLRPRTIGFRAAWKY